MTWAIELSDGRVISGDAFRAEFPQFAFSGSVPPGAALKAVGARAVKMPRYATSAEAKAAMVAWIDGLTAQVMDQYPRAVQARWSIEEEAARAVKHDAEEDNPQNHIATADQIALVTNEGAAKGRTPTEHADAIIANTNRFRDIANEINALFLATDKALTDATEPEQYEGILQAAIAKAAPLATAYGLNT